MKILAIGAHPDDVEFGCGGLVIKEVLKGSQVKIVVCSLGEAGTNGTPTDRKKEATAAAKLAGAKIEFLNLGGDCHIQDSPTNAIKLAGIIRKFKPNIVLAPEMQRNQHPDHYAVAKIAHAACRVARYGGLKEIKKLPIHKVDALYFYPSRAEWSSRPDVVIDVSDVQNLWEKTMSAHKSQMKTKSYHDLVFTKAQAMGASVGVKYAIGLWTNDPIRLNRISDLNLSSRNY
ncbi:MAG: PIG-L family deacetylase [Candidatus Doudnabacteria bacterium]|jgi:bacillithiol biosynthesis deacetylase BshB1